MLNQGTVDLELDGVSSRADADRVQNALLAVRGVSDVHIDIEKGCGEGKLQKTSNQAHIFPR